ncbi:hypothetical protein AB0G73_02900 [Streptomyces sp. NPDC020719]|uniref:hypothetical protein n=1 Tax=Streptomyces sp. NPDC020719 TaxID=3154896 RepID=UPI0033E483C4
MAQDYARTLAGTAKAEGTEHRPPAPPNTQPEHCTPNGIAVGDYVLVAGRYRRVNDMCNRGGATERVLMLEGFGPWVMTTNHLIYRPIKRGHVRTHHASGRQTSMALLSAKVRYRQGGLTVPFITAWDSERITVPRLGVRVSGAGPSIYFADEGPMDRDQHGILWVRQGLGRGRGKAPFPTVHAYRQRRAMYDLLCQVYGGRTYVREFLPPTRLEAMDDRI